MEDRILIIANRIFKHDVDIDSKSNDFDSWDSLGQLTLFMSIESELGIKFTHKEIINTNSIKEIVNLIENKYLNNKA